MRIILLRSLIILYGHEVSSYCDFTAATRSIVPPRRGYHCGKIVASVSHRYDTVNSSPVNTLSMGYPRGFRCLWSASQRESVDRLSLLFISVRRRVTAWTRFSKSVTDTGDSCRHYISSAIGLTR